MPTSPDPLPPSRRGLTAPSPPPAANGAGARADRTREYVAAYGDGTGQAGYLKSLPTYVDDVERDYPHVYEEMLKDEVVSASVKTVVYSVLQEGVELRPAVDDEGDPDYAAAKRHVDEAEAAFDYFDLDVEDLCRELLYSLCLGWLAAEKTVGTLEGGKYDGLDCFESVRVKPRRNTSPVVTPTNRLAGYLCRVVGRPWGQFQGMVVGDVRKHPNYVPREKFVHAAWDGRECDPRGRSILRPVYRRWYEKIQTCGDWLKHLAQFGSPWVVGTTAPGSDSAAVVDGVGNPAGTAGGPLSPEQEFLNKLVQFRNGGAIAVPSGWTVQLLQAASAGDAFVKKVDSCDRAITQGITLQTLATTEGEHQARAAAQVHQDTLGLLPGAVRRWLRRLLERQLLRPFVAMNHGPEAARLAPRLALEKVAQEDRAKMLAAWASVGWKVAPSQTPAVDEELGLEPRTPEEAQPPEPPKPPAVPPGGGNGGGGPPGKDAGPLDAAFAFDEAQHPRGQPENRGQFGPGGGGAGGEARGDRPQGGYHEEAARVAGSAYQNMRALLAKMKKGEYHPEDVLDDVEHYAAQAEAGSRSLFASRYNAWREHVRTAYGPDALRTPAWRAVRDAFREAQDRAAEPIDGMADVVRAEAKYAAAHPDLPIKIDRASVDMLADRHNELVQSYDDAVGRIADAIEAFQKVPPPGKGPPGAPAAAGNAEAPFAFDPDEPRDEAGKWTAGGGAGQANSFDQPVHGGRTMREFYREVNRATPTRPDHPAYHDPVRLAVEGRLHELAGDRAESLYLPKAGATLVAGVRHDVLVTPDGPGRVAVSSFTSHGPHARDPAAFTLTADTPPAERDYRLRKALGLKVDPAERARYVAADKAARKGERGRLRERRALRAAERAARKAASDSGGPRDEAVFGRWVTLEDDRHVYIDDAGNVRATREDIARAGGGKESRKSGQEGLTSPTKETILPVEAENPTGVQKMTTQGQLIVRALAADEDAEPVVDLGGQRALNDSMRRMEAAVSGSARGPLREKMRAAADAAVLAASVPTEQEMAALPGNLRRLWEDAARRPSFSRVKRTAELTWGEQGYQDRLHAAAAAAADLVVEDSRARGA